MTIVSSFIFAFAGIAAVVTLWKTLTTALPAIRALHRNLSAEMNGHAIHVSTLNTRRRQRRPSRRVQAGRQRKLAHVEAA